RRRCCRCHHLCSNLPITCCQRGVIGLWKFSPFLPLSILVLYQACILQVVPFSFSKPLLQGHPRAGLLVKEHFGRTLASCPVHWELCGHILKRRSALESLPDPAVLPEEESRLLLAALVKDYVRMKVRALEQETEGASGFLCGSRCLEVQMGGEREQDLQTRRESPRKRSERERAALVPAQKGSCNTATCVTQWLAGLLSSSGGGVKSNFVPTDVGSKAFGRHCRDLQA
ncbi:calcitonin gene-related peptide 1-like, partial [Equus asinus]|uniref:calcitonin gene-related peptide 1-like n=1 Tax=Equus asinus TaxID=9793 RepID=UPI0038F7CE25